MGVQTPTRKVFGRLGYGFRFPEPIFDTMKVFFHTEEGTKLKTHSLTYEEYLQDSLGEAILQNVRGKEQKKIG